MRHHSPDLPDPNAGHFVRSMFRPATNLQISLTVSNADSGVTMPDILHVCTVQLCLFYILVCCSVLFFNAARRHAALVKVLSSLRSRP